MTHARNTAAWLYGVTGVISIVLGAYYILRGSFMPYHAEAIGTEWSALTSEMQTLFLALLDVAGAGWAVSGLLVVVLVLVPFRQGKTWARWTIPVALVLLYVPILLATLSVTHETPATPPWYGNAIALLAILSGIALDRPWRRTTP